MNMSLSKQAVRLFVGIEWDATRAYIDSVKSGIGQMANYLYDVSDGQIKLRHIWVREDMGRNPVDELGNPFYFDIMLLAQNDHAGYVSRRGHRHIQFPRRYFKSNSANNSAAELGMNPASPEHFQKLAQLLGGHLLDLRSESRKRIRSGCDIQIDLGFMA